MPIERGTVTSQAKLTLVAEPGFFLWGSMDGPPRIEMTFSGSVGVRALSRLIEEAVALREELQSVTG